MRAYTPGRSWRSARLPWSDTRACRRECLGRLRAPPGEVGSTVAPVPPPPLGQRGRDVAVFSHRVLPAQRELPADVRLQLEWRHPPLEGCPVQGAARPAFVVRTVEEDTGAPDEAGDGLPALRAPERAVSPPPLRPELPLGRSERARCGQHPSASASPVKCAPYEQQPCTSSGAGSVSTPWQPRPKMQFQELSRKVTSITHVRSSSGSSKLSHSCASGGTPGDVICAVMAPRLLPAKFRAGGLGTAEPRLTQAGAPARRLGARTTGAGGSAGSGAPAPAPRRTAART